MDPWQARTRWGTSQRRALGLPGLLSLQASSRPCSCRPPGHTRSSAAGCGTPAGSRLAKFADLLYCEGTLHVPLRQLRSTCSLVHVLRCWSTTQSRGDLPCAKLTLSHQAYPLPVTPGSVTPQAYPLPCAKLALSHQAYPLPVTPGSVTPQAYPLPCAKLALSHHRLTPWPTMLG